jgi:hypothetical protein
MSDYRVKITIRNDRLLSKMEEMGFQSVMQNFVNILVCLTHLLMISLVVR